MTKEEAIKIAHDTWFGSFPAKEVPHALVDTLAALGMLKLEEPKSVFDRLRAIQTEKGFGAYWADNLIADLDRAGLQIVEKGGK